MKKMKNSKVRRYISIFAMVFLAAYLLYQVCYVNYKPVETQTALLKTVEKGIDTTVFIVRDEHYMSSASGNKIRVPMVNDGERIAKDECIAAEFSSDDEADRFLKTQEIEKQIEKYEILKSQEKINISNIETFDKDTNSLFSEYIDNIMSGDFSEANDTINSFCDKITSRQTAMGAVIDYDSLISQLNNQLSALGNTNPSYIYSDSTGYFISNTDGYEGFIDYEKIDEITTSQIEKAINHKVETEENNIGKIVDNYNWYMVCSVKMKDVENLEVGDTVKVRFKNAASVEEKVTVHTINKESRDKVALVLKSNSVSSKFFPLRIEEIKIITETFEGYKIDKDALRTLNGVNGVYILRGRIVNFRRVSVIHTEEDYVVVRTKEKEQEWLINSQERLDSEENRYNALVAKRLTEEPKYIINSESSYSSASLLDSRYVSLYDEVIVKGRDVYAGKLI